MRSLGRWMPLIISVIVSSGCQHQYQHSQHEIKNTQTQIARLRLAPTLSPAVASTRGFFVSAKPIPIAKEPYWTRRVVNIKARAVPLGTLMDNLLGQESILIHYAEKNLANQPITLDYHGPLSGAIERIEAQIQAEAQWDHDQLTWTRWLTESFDISFLPGASTYFVGRDAKSQASNQASDTLTNTLDPQFSNLQGALSVWEDLENTLNQLKSPEGKIMVSEATTSVTVSDHPKELHTIARYLHDLNQRLGQQVAIRVQVLELHLNQADQFGLDWSLVANTLGGQFQLHHLSDAGNHLLQSAGFIRGRDQALLNALNQQAAVRVVTQPEVTTLNNQMAAIHITQQTGYIESISQTNNEFSSTSAINPGHVTEGLTLYLLPKIQDNDVFLQISSTLASLDKLEKVSDAPTDKLNETSSASNTSYQAIQVPTIAQKSFNQRSRIPSGATLIIAGYQRAADQNTHSGGFGVEALSDKSSKSEQVETLILITPVILRDRGSHALPHHA